MRCLEDKERRALPPCEDGTMKRKAMYQTLRRGFHRYINGRKGVISLFLAFSLSPLLGTTLVLEEYVRYQNVVELMGEITSSSALSTLGNYDSHLDERFGLMSISEEHADLNGLFNEYYNPNLSLIGDSAESIHATVEGKYPLSDETVLRQQILENAELSVPAEFMFTGFDMGKWESKIAEHKGKEDELKLAESGVKMGELFKNLAKFGNDLKKVNESSETYSKNMKAYKDASKAFNSACQTLAALNAEHAILMSNPATVSEAEAMEPEIEAQKRVVNAARDAYKEAIGPFRESVDEVKGNIGELMQTMRDIPDNIKEVGGEKDDKSDAKKSAAEKEADFADKVYGQMTNATLKYDGDGYKEAMGQNAADLIDQKGMLNGFDAEEVGTGWSEGSYAAIHEFYTEGDIAKLVGLQNALNLDAALSSTNAKMLSNFLSVLEKLEKLQGFYDSSYNSEVSPSDMYVPTTMAFSSVLGVDSLNHMIRACRALTLAVAAPSAFQFIHLCEALVEFFVAFVEFVTGMFQWIMEVFNNLVSLASNPVSFYDDLLLFGYAGYNLPNRTNAKDPDGESLYGYSYQDLFLSAGGRTGLPVLGALVDFAGGHIDGRTERKPLFKGAELEYMLVGGVNEIDNQAAAFYDNYMFRLALDALPIVLSKEVKEMGAACGPLFWVPYILLFIFEPLIDTFVLVNGGYEYLFKQTLYLTPSGIEALAIDIKGIAGLEEETAGKLKDGMEKILTGGSSGTPKSSEPGGGTSKSSDEEKPKLEGDAEDNPKKKGIFKMKYAEHGILLLMLRTNPTTYMNRLRNIIYMENRYEHRGEFNFDLDKSYTLITVNTEYHMNPLFRLPSLTSGGPFTVRKTKDYYY